MKTWLRTTSARAVAIVSLGIGAGFAGNQISPRGLPLIAQAKPTQNADEFIALERAKELWDGGAVLFLDAREADDFAAGHIGNALNLPAMSFGQHIGEIAPTLTPTSELILYCDGSECDLSHRLAESLRKQGYTNLHILVNGWSAWRHAGLPATVPKLQ